MLMLGSTLYASGDYRSGRLMAFPGESHGDLGFPRWPDPEPPPA
jgi:hypothetical protein